MNVQERRTHEGPWDQLQPIGWRKSTEGDQYAGHRHPDVEAVHLLARWTQCNSNYVALQPLGLRPAACAITAPVAIETDERRALGFGIIPGRGFPFRVSIPVCLTSAFPQSGTKWISQVLDASIPTCHSLWTPADLHTLTMSGALCWLQGH